MAQDNKDSLVFATAVQIPPFWSEDPAAWFLSIEAQFAIKGINQDNTKYYHALSKLDVETIKNVKDIATNAPQVDSYSQLKKRLCSSYELTDEARASRILDCRSLGDMKPSQLARDLLHAMGDKDGDFLLKHVFLRAMPKEVRGPVAASKKKLLELSQEADQVWMNTVGTTSGQNLQVNQVNKKSDLCRFHKKFGDKARKCVSWCKKFKEFSETNAVTPEIPKN